jgi:glycosyltransferase involved in cell wall biosynthesis
MGYLCLETNPAFLLQCMQKLHYLDPDYRLSVCGRFESSALEQYVRHMARTLGLTHVVSFTSNPGDLNAWLADKHFIVSSALGEGQVETLLAGMACGLKPVVHNFPGAETLFPRECLFNIAEEFCDQVTGREYDPKLYRRFVEDRYPIDKQLKQVHGVLTQLETEIDLRRSSGDNRGPAPIFNIPVPEANGSPAPKPVDFANLR